MSLSKKQNTRLESKVPAYFYPEQIGKELREVAVDFLQVDAETIRSRWFHCSKDADLFIWSNEHGHLIKAQVSFCGHVVEWNALEGLKTGATLEEEGDASRSNASEIIIFDSSPHSLAVDTALRMVEHVPGLEGDLKHAVLRSLKGEAGLLMTRFTVLPSHVRISQPSRLKPNSKENWLQRLKRRLSTFFQF